MKRVPASTFTSALQQALRVDDPSGVGAARRAASEIARALSFDEIRAAEAALAVTELGTNIVKHAGAGEILIRPLSRHGNLGIELLALDRGPGMADPAQSLRDGHSTAGSPGTGLGALRRLSRCFQLFSRAGHGTAVRLELWAGGPDVVPREDALDYGVICLARNGEPAPGDDWAVLTADAAASLLVADGLGHGADARTAALQATAQLHEHPDASPSELIRLCHRALAKTRGAAVGAARLDTTGNTGEFAGVGNICCRIETPAVNHSLASHNGILGHNVRKIQQFAFSFPAQAVMVLHSDGLASNWSLTRYPGLLIKHPALIAGVLYRDYHRGRDDVTVIVAKRAGGAQA